MSRRREGKNIEAVVPGRGAGLPGCSAGHAGRCSSRREPAGRVSARGAPGGTWPGGEETEPRALRRRRGDRQSSLPYTLTSSLDPWSWASGRMQAGADPRPEAEAEGGSSPAATRKPCRFGAQGRPHSEPSCI